MNMNWQSLWLRYGAAVLSVLVAVPVACLLLPLEPSPSSAFLAAVIVTSWYSGLGPGLLATVLSVVVLDFVFLAPVWALGTELADGLRLLVFISLAVLVSSLHRVQIRLESKLREQARSKDRFLAVLAHELRNPLSALLNALEVLRRRPTDGATVEQVRQMMDRQAHAIAKQIDDLLDITRVSQGKIRLERKQIELSEVAALAIETLRPLIESRRHRLITVFPTDILTVDADPERLEQVISNLLTNAAKYTETGGKIYLWAEKRNNEAVLGVRDTGIGIEPELLPRIFDLFVQAQDGSRGGLGIGLNLARSLVELHGGTIAATSAGLGHGSEFVVRLPLIDPALADTIFGGVLVPSPRQDDQIM